MQSALAESLLADLLSALDGEEAELPEDEELDEGSYTLQGALAELCEGLPCWDEEQHRGAVAELERRVARGAATESHQEAFALVHEHLQARLQHARATIHGEMGRVGLNAVDERLREGGILRGTREQL